jgi:hypothetical protein
MKFRVLMTCLVALCLCGVAIAADVIPVADVPDYLQQISVTIKSGYSQGSGTLVVRKIGEDTAAFVWTAAHVVDNLRHVRRVITPDGDTKVLIEFKDPQIVQELYQNGRRVGETKLDCKVIKYSDAEYGEDLAVLMVRRLNAYSATVCAKFPTKTDYIPPMGVDVSHCGSLLGQFGANSYTTGVLSQTGRLLEGKGASSKVFDQVTAVAFPGSSGGGVYLKADGTYIGMLTQGVMQSQGFNFIVPVRRIQTWAKEAKIEWTINTSVTPPTLAEIEKIPVESGGIMPNDGSVAPRGGAPACVTPEWVKDFGNWLYKSVK